jgi:alpha-amylase
LKNEGGAAMKKGIITFILIPFLLFYALPAGAAEKEERKWQDETIYFLMILRWMSKIPRPIMAEILRVL